MMYKVLLVDDEILIREAIKENIKWEANGYELIGLAENGKEAIEQIKENQPDVILTDICMPFIDGIGLAKYVYETYPNIKVVIISGYDEFDYAKRALKYRVIDYVLKPVTAVELTDILVRVKDVLDREQEESKQIEKIKQAYADNLPVMKERFLNQLLEGSYKKKDIEEKLSRLGISLMGDCYSVVLIDIEDCNWFLNKYPEAKEDLVSFAVSNIANELVETSGQAVAFISGADQGILIFAANTEENLEVAIEKQCSEIYKMVEEYLKVRITMIVGRTVYALAELYQSYDNAKETLEYKFSIEAGPFIYGRDFLSITEERRVQITPWIEQLLPLIKTNQNSEIKRLIENLFYEFRDSFLSKKTILIYLQNMVLSVTIALDDADIGTGDSFEREKEILNDLESYKKLGDLKEIFLEFCLKIADFIVGKRDGYWQKQAVLALDYIDKNYQNANLSLNLLCSHLNMSTSYFSSIYKNYTGETFVETLTKKRIEKAKKLLATTSMKAYEVADEVGYSDSHYFSATFKKYTCQTPTEYAKTMR